jgi:polyhydroxyalkanoate synthesis regulator phasin
MTIGFREALESILEQVLGPVQRFHDDASNVADDEPDDVARDEEGETHDKEKDEAAADDETEELQDYNYDPELLTTGWFTDPEAKEVVSRILRQFQLDESTIEAEAIRRSFSDLELLDKMLASLEARRDKALRCIGEYHESLARQLRKSADQIIEGRDLFKPEQSDA